MSPDLSRVRDVFDAAGFSGNVAVVGCGAIGSRLASLLCDVGLGDRLDLIDGDHVERHNLSSQTFDVEDIGKPKVEALAARLRGKWATGTQGPKLLPSYVAGPGPLRKKVVASCVDSMKTRRMLAEGVLLNGVTELFLDARITARTVFAIRLDPRDARQHRQYLEELYDDPPPAHDAVAGGCAITPSIAPTASIAASLLAWHLFDWHAGKDGPNELVVDLSSWEVHRRRYARSGDARSAG